MKWILEKLDLIHGTYLPDDFALVRSFDFREIQCEREELSAARASGPANVEWIT